MQDCTIIGIDPGTNVLGYGIICVCDNKPHFKDMGIVKMSGNMSQYDKLLKIFTDVGAICDKYKPDMMALESPFLDKNAQVIMKLGRAQGAAILSARTRKIEVSEYAPRKAKIAITGTGTASKQQVSNMISSSLGIDTEGVKFDATDALAIALCHFYQLCSPISDIRSRGGWEQFLKDNPERIVR